jgi:twitching motility protein PilT
MAVKESTFNELLRAAIEYGASDIHIREGEPPCFRINGDLIPIKSPPVQHDDLSSISSFLLDGVDQLKNLSLIRELDGGKTFEGICRVRFNFFRFQEKLGVILRLIKNNVPSIDELKISKTIKSIAENKRGLVLITGATGSGKSTTMAAMIEHINSLSSGHIITIEDPVEYLFTQNQSRITQREVGVDTGDFNSALRSALRQDPDVIAIGEMRDQETVDICLKAAETGHMVISTIHTNNAENTIGRIIAMFPPEAQKDARIRLSENLFATISQRMLKTKEGTGRVVAQEIMINTPGVRECISGKEDMKNLYTYIREGFNPGAQYSSQTFDQHLKLLLKNKVITKQEAIKAASSGGDFARSLDIEK